MSDVIRLDRYRLLGRSGLRVSPVALGTQTFGVEWGWGTQRDEARQIFDAYIERGGNFIDTANVYTNGTSETFLGQFMAGERDRLVVSTKYTLPDAADDPNSGGNHRKSMVRSVEKSLRRLNTDYIDLLFLHAWDATTPVEEVLRAMDDLVRSGKVLYLGISNTVAWQVSRMQAIAELRGYAPLIAMQIEYNLIQRTGERDLMPMAREMGLGLMPYSPLAEGILAGRYSKSDIDARDAVADGTRKTTVIAGGAVSTRSLAIADVVRRIARDMDKPPAQVAIAWVLQNPNVTSMLIGARTLKQFEENLGALDLSLTPAHLEQLSAASALELGYPHDFYNWLMNSGLMLSSMRLG